MQRNRKLLAVTLASLLLFSAFAPGAMAAATVANSDSGNTSTSGNTGTTANAELSVSVETGNAADVTANSATLSGELTELSGAEEASVSIHLYEEGDKSTKEIATLGEQSEGTFSTDVSGLSPGTTYVFVAKASAESGNAEVEDTGEEVSFTTANAETGPQPLGVETGDATEVTGNAATLNGELTGVGNAEDVYVQFVYQATGNAAVGNAQTVDAGILSETGGFSADLTGLEDGTTYVYYARATTSNAAVTGEERTFTAGETVEEDEGFVPPNGPFGQQVVAFIDYMRNAEDGEERNFGQAISSWVTANNPGADNRPDHAGPPEDKERGPNKDDDKRRGPPTDKGPNAKDDDKRRGPPTDKGPNKDDDDDGDVTADTADTDDGDDGDDVEDDSDEEEDDDEEDDKGGPPEGKGYNK